MTATAARAAMSDQELYRRGNIAVHRLLLAPGEAMAWHRDPYQRVAVVLQGDRIAIEFRDNRETLQIEVTPGQVDWEQPGGAIHRAVNVGQKSYEQVTVFLLDKPDAVAQPTED
jgi:quercetin dioxygenase-like cupin family protein